MVELLEQRICLSTVAFSSYLGGPGDDQAAAIAVDTADNVYVTGTFSGTMDFDTGPGVFNLSAGSYDAFVSKFDSAGNFVWARQLGSGSNEVGKGIAVDGAGNVCTTGFFLGTADFDPGPGVFNLSSAGSSEAFVSKLDSAGNFVWARRMGGGNGEAGQDIAVDGVGNVYTTGYFGADSGVGLVDFDPGPGVFNLTSLGDHNTFVLKLDGAGNFVWAQALGSSTDDGYGIAVDGVGNVYTTGNFVGTSDFDPGAGVFNLTSAGIDDAFVWKLDSAGSFVWARQLGGSGNDPGRDIAVDGAGAVYTTGRFNGTADFDPGVGVFNLTSAGINDASVSKLDSAGSFVWARQLGGSDEVVGLGIAVDGAGAVYTVGHFNGSADFDPGAGVFNLTNAGGDDAFVSKLDSAGNFLWVQPLGGNSGDIGFGIAEDSSGSVYATGYTSSTNFPTTGPFQAANGGGNDGFLTKITDVIPVTPVTIDIKPGSDENPINLANQGVIPVTLFGSESFDVAQVELASVVFAGAHVYQSSLQDVNGDGELDLVMQFRTQDTNLRAVYESLLAAEDTNTNGALDSTVSTHQLALVSLTGQTLSEEQFEGFDLADLFLSGRSLRDFLALLVSQGQI